MSRDLLRRLLIEEINEIKTSSDVFRYNSDMKTHEFFVNEEDIERQILAEIRERNKRLKKDNGDPRNRIPITNKVRAVAKAGAANIVKHAQMFWDTKHGAVIGGRDKVSISKIVDGTLIIIVSSPLVADVSRVKTSSTGASSRQTIHATIFESVRESYKKARRNLARNLNKVLIEEGYTGDTVGGQFLNLGHRGASSIIKERIIERKKNLSSAIKKMGVITQEDIDRLFGPDFFTIKKVSGKDGEKIQVTIESAILNQLRGTKSEKRLKDKYIKALERATIKLNKTRSFADREGSDSRKTLIRKRLVKAFADQIIPKKSVKVKSINTKPRYSNNTAKEKVNRKKPKLIKTTGKVKVPTDLNLELNEGTSFSAINLTALLGQINTRLPGKIRENMTPPALQFRTGRFASSVRATDIVQTPKGFPSIGYTYMKYPYQTFEPGFRQGSVERDPRSLIDRSIREVAAELLKGRFYTRRI